jgi:hypothetical protein
MTPERVLTPQTRHISRHGRSCLARPLLRLVRQSSITIEQFYSAQSPEPVLIQLSLDDASGLGGLLGPGWYSLNGGLPGQPRDWALAWGVGAITITSSAAYPTGLIGKQGELHIDQVDGNHISGTGTFVMVTNDGQTSQWALAFDAPLHCK